MDDAQGRDNADLSAGNLDQVREILFGAQNRTIDKRLAQLESDLPRLLGELRDDTRRSLEQLEAATRASVHELHERVNAEQRDRAQAAADLHARADADTGAIRQSLALLDDTTGAAFRDVRQQLADRSAQITDDLQRRADELHAALTRAVDDLRTQKADRATVATFLRDMAARLTDGLPAPDAGDGQHS